MGIRYILSLFLIMFFVSEVMAANKTTTTKSVETKQYIELPKKEVVTQEATIQEVSDEVVSSEEATTQEASDEVVSSEEASIQEVQTISATPVDKPLSNQLREKRQQLEMDTEEKMNQELEKARIEDEKIRGEKIFSSNSFEPVQSQPVIKSETIVSTKIETQELVSEKNLYLGLMGGALNYPQVENINALNGAAGVSLGVALPLNLWIEGSFLYSFQETEINRFVGTETEQIDHFGLTGSALYRWDLSFAKWITPVAGLALSYTRRQTNGGDGSSNAFDGGVVLGADIPVFKTVSLGLEYRYMTNIDYDRTNKPSTEDVALQQFATGTLVQNIESIDYQLIFINTKLTF